MYVPKKQMYYEYESVTSMFYGLEIDGNKIPIYKNVRDSFLFRSWPIVTVVEKMS